MHACLVYVDNARNLSNGNAFFFCSTSWAAFCVFNCFII